jgi:Ran GTPase-activating protein (RanGAP) involved in mRNA processing and transport
VEALIRSNPPLKDLNLSRNHISDKGAIVFADFLGSHYHLRTVKISWNKIKTNGGIAIAEALKYN